jgi:hypothetical protein
VKVEAIDMYVQVEAVTVGVNKIGAFAVPKFTSKA